MKVEEKTKKIKKYLKEMNKINHKYGLWCDFEAIYFFPPSEKNKWLVVRELTKKLKMPEHYHVEWSDKDD